MGYVRSAVPEKVERPTAESPLLAAVDRAVEARWDQALRAAARTGSGSPRRRVAKLSAEVTRELTAIGAAAGAAAAVPGAGTLAVAGTTAAEGAWFALRMADLVMAVGAVHGHTEATAEQRRAWVLSVLAFGDTASAGVVRLVRDLGSGLGLRKGQAPSIDVLQAVNRTLVRQLLARWGARRGAASLGRLLPFGVGAVVGGAANYASAQSIARQAERFFADLPAELWARPGELGTAAPLELPPGDPA